MTDFYGGGTAALDAGRQHHLLRHSLPQEERGAGVLCHFGADSVSEAFKLIKKMSQRDLQAKFKAIYGAKTFSNNNNWLRRKLFEAIGVDPAKGAGKKTAGVGQKRRKAPAKAPRPAAAVKAAAAAALYEMDHSAAEALLALGDVACMQLSEMEEEGEESEEPSPSAAYTGASSDAAAAPTLTGGEESPLAGGDREVPGNSPRPLFKEHTSPFAPGPLAESELSAGSQHRASKREEEQGETEAAATSALLLAAPGSRANSSCTLALPPLDPASDLSHMTSNVGQLYAWLLARQQQHLAAAAAAAAGGAPGFVHPLMAPLPAYAMMGGLLPPVSGLPMAPPLFSAAKGN